MAGLAALAGGAGLEALARQTGCVDRCERGRHCTQLVAARRKRFLRRARAPQRSGARARLVDETGLALASVLQPLA